MDYATLFQALTQAQSENEKSNPYAGVAGISDQLGDVILKRGASGQDSLTETLVGSLLAGIVGGGANYLGQDYTTRQNKLAEDVLLGSLTGKVFERPEGMSPSVFSKMSNTGAFMKLAQEAEKKKAADTVSNQLKLEGLKSLMNTDDPYALGQKQQILKSVLGENAPNLPQPVTTEGGAPGTTPMVARASNVAAELSQMPQNLRATALQEKEIKDKNENLFGLIDSIYEGTKNINSLQALIPASTAKNEMEGAGIRLTTALQAALGREMNAKEQERLAAITPDWNDTTEQLDLKKQNFLALAQAISKPTPVLDSMGGGSVQQAVEQTKAAAPIKSINGANYQKVDGGWQRIP